jgi:hypothetical protein
MSGAEAADTGAMRLAGAAAVAALGWTLTFGSPKTGGVGWKTIDRFDSEAACEEERADRAREVRDKTSTNQPLEVVLAFYRCVRSD